MTTAAEATIGGGFSIGNVASETFAVIGRNFVPFILLTLIAAVPGDLIVYYLGVLGRTGANLLSPMYLLVFWVGELVSVALAFILQASLTYASFMDISGKRVSVGDAIGVALKAVLPLIAIAILFTIAIGVGFVLLIVPGLMILTAWSVVIPTYVVEKPGIFASFRRSADLTHGHRWPIFGLLVILWIALTILGLATRPLFGLTWMSQIQTYPVGYLGVLLVQRVISMMISSTGAAVMYYQLRTSKEGGGATELAAVFD